MKILMISSFLPYPLYSGGNIRLYNLIKELSKKHEITLVCEKRAHQTQKDIEEVEKICKKVLTVDRAKQWTMNNVLKTGFSRNAFLITGHNNKKMRIIIKEEIEKDSYDLIHAETSYIFQNIPVTTLPIVLVEHNIEYLIYQRYADIAPLPLRPLLKVDVAKLKRLEELDWKEATRVAAMSSVEKAIIEKTGVHADIVPNGVDVHNFSLKNLSARTKKKINKILYIGDFTYIQNKDAATFIIEEIWPKIISKHQHDNIKLWIVGRKIPESIKTLSNDQNILFDENATQPTWEVFQEADVLLAPIRIGAGTQYKILEALSVGTPVVTTPLGTEGIGAKKDEEILIGKTADELAEETVRVLTNNKKYDFIAKNARELIEKNYSWETIAKKLDEVYNATINNI